MKRRTLASLLVAVAVVAALAACGRKGSPVAPEQRLPQPVTDLRGVIRAGGVELTWTLPRRRMDNTKLGDAAIARVFRAEDGGEGEPRSALLADDRVPGYTEVGTVRVLDPPSPLVQGDRVTFADRRNLTLGRRYTYVVLTTDAQGRTSAPSPRVTLVLAAAPEPPAGLRAEPGEREVRLSWQPPARLTDGTPVSGPLVYDVLRAATPDGPLVQIARTEPGVATAVDRAVENDRAYTYAVRAVRRDGATVAEGEPSARVTATPADMTPPAPPSSLVAIPSERTVRLSWTPSRDIDVTAYVVYRAVSGGPFERIGSVRVPGATFTDRDVPAGVYRYAVTAQDASARANESARSNEVSVTVP